MKFLTLILTITFLTSLSSCQTKSIKPISLTTTVNKTTKLTEIKKYILKKQTENSDFNYSKLNDIDGSIKETLNAENLMPIFEPVNGQYKHYQFISTFVGQGYNSDGPPLHKDFHDILIIKTDDKDKIIDAFHYTLEWAEPPLQYDVFKSTAKSVTLTNNLELSQLKFQRTYSRGDDNKEMNENGLIILTDKTTIR